jgi:multiple antibiotic resistance protein
MLPLRGAVSVFATIVHAMAGIFAVMNPIGNVPLFLSLTGDCTVAERRATARKAVFAAFLILLGFIILGQFIFALFDITIAAFRVAGGILIFAIAYNLLQGTPSHAHAPREEEHRESEQRDDVAVTPLATPLLAGPGAIATVMALSGGPHMLQNSMAVLIGLVAVLAGTYLILHSAGSLGQRLTRTEMNVITRLMGLLLSIIAVQMAVAGLQDLFPGWVRG